MVTHTGHRVSDTSICPDDTPEGWLLPQFRDVLTINYGKGLTESNRVAGAISVYGSNGLVGHHDKALTKGPCIIVGRKGTVGAVHLSKGPCWPIDTTYFIDDFSGLLPEYVFYALGQSGLGQLDTSTAIPGLNRDDVYRLQFPLPPLAEQKRIVAKVEELLARVNAGRDRLDKVPRIMRRFRQAVLAAACSGKLTEDWREKNPEVESGSECVKRLFGEGSLAKVPSDEDPIEPPELPESWAWTRCEKLCDRNRVITYGVIKLGAPVTGGVPTLRSSDVRWLRIDDSHVKCISRKIAAEYSRTFLQGGEILVTVRGTLGGVGVVPASVAGFNISREVAVVPVDSQISANFVSLAIGRNWSQSWLSEVTKGVTYTGINIRDLKRLPIPIPPLEEQREIVRRVDALLKLADAIEKRVAAARLRADKLTQSILAKAFRGELVPTEAELARREGRSYEPASVLLERIRAEREKQKPQAKKRRTRG